MTKSSRFILFLSTHWLGLVGLFLTLSLSISALLATWVAPFDPGVISLKEALCKPNSTHWLGCDELGRDILSRIIYGGRASLLIGPGSVLLALIVGGPLGMLAGYRGGWFSRLIMRSADILLTFPGFIMAVGVMAVLGPGILNITIALSLRSLPIFIRVSRNETLSLREENYVEAARALGNNSSRILLKHILPNLINSLFVLAVLRTGSAILTGAELSFLGLGVPPELAEWGNMTRTGLKYIRMEVPHLIMFPGFAIVTMVSGLNLLADDLRNMWDPHVGRKSAVGA